MKQSRPPLVRMQHIDRQLKENRYPNCSQVARYFEVSSKSIQRDIDYMRDVLGDPIAYDRKRRGYRYEKTGWNFLPSKILEGKEAEACMATKKVLAQLQGLSLLRGGLPRARQGQQYLPENSAADDLLSIYSFEQSSSAGIESRTFARIEDAIRGRLKVNMTCRASWNQEVTERTVHPYLFRYSPVRETWHLIGHCELRNEIRTFAIHRIRTLALTGKKFTIPETFSLENYVDKTFDQIHRDETHRVAIRFTPFQAQWIREQTWHPSQEIEEHANGGLTLRMTVGALEAVKRWVLRHGCEAQVLEPQKLREMMKTQERSVCRPCHCSNEWMEQALSHPPDYITGSRKAQHHNRTQREQGNCPDGSSGNQDGAPE